QIVFDATQFVIAWPSVLSAPPMLSVAPVPVVKPVERSTTIVVVFVRDVISYHPAVIEPVPPWMYNTLPTTSVPKFAVALVIVVVPLVTASVTEYCAAFCCDQSVPDAPRFQPPPLVSLPLVGRNSHSIAALRAMN